ncbi:MAG: hypothetical protein IKR36_03815, partial [Clostridia bacterium]|nr:hypothetical protein [Clostridia bacterium]
NLSGAVFTLTDENGENVALPAYSSGADGLITIAYLAPGVYTLTEVSAPKGYVVLDQPLTLTLDSGYRITVTPGSDQYAVTPDPSGAHIAVLTIRDRTTGLVVKKKNALTGQPLADVHFALYHQVTQTDGTVRKDYRPIPGYDDLVTDENGIVPQVTEALQAGTYYLSETQAAAGFILPEDDLCFTIGTDGTVSLNNHENWLVREVISGSVSYTITIPNGEEPEPVEVEVSGVKVLTGRDMEAGEFTFSLYQIDAAGAIVEGGAWRKASNPAGAAGEQKTFTFDPLVYTLSDFNDAAYHDASGRAVFYYIVEEDVPEGGVKNAVVYSTARFLVVVRLAYVDDSLLAVKEYYQYDDAIPSNLMPVEMMPDSIRMNA